MRKLLLCLTPILLTGLMQQILAAPIIKSSEETYPVQGSNINEILAEVNKEGPKADGKRFSAVTEANVSWKADLSMENDQCRLSNLQVTDTNHYVLPVWVDYPQATPDMQQTWNKDITLLKQHEEQHGNNSVRAAYAVENMLLNLPPMANCDDLKAAADKNTDNIIQQYKQIDVAFDSRTEHGAKQG